VAQEVAVRNVLAAALIGICGSALAASGPGDEVSRSRGRGGGVVVLWPRIVPETEDPEVLDLAARLQRRVQEAVSAGVVPNRIDVRPAPERVCPMHGCRASSVGLLLGHQDGGCVAVAVVGPPGPEPQRLVPLAGRVQMDAAGLPFREAPEGRVVITEFVPCAELELGLDPAALGGLVGAPATTAPAGSGAPVTPAQTAPAPPAPL
jgi:hypothetical protein